MSFAWRIEVHAARCFSAAGLATVVVLHGLAFWGLLKMNVASRPTPQAALTVDLLPAPLKIQPPAPPRHQPSALEQRVESPIKPLRQPMPQWVQPPVQLPAQPSAHLAVPENAPAAPAPAVPPAPTFAEPAPPVPPPAAAVTTVPPRFDADYLHNPKPPYPPLSRRMGEAGRVVLRVQVRADGAADEVLIDLSSGSPRLDQAALDSVRRWQFVPARRGDDPVAATVRVPIVFGLKE